MTGERPGRKQWEQFRRVKRWEVVVPVASIISAVKRFIKWLRKGL
jgi:hypothetical protein